MFSTWPAMMGELVLPGHNANHDVSCGAGRVTLMLCGRPPPKQKCAFPLHRDIMVGVVTWQHELSHHSWPGGEHGCSSQMEFTVCVGAHTFAMPG